MKLYHATTPKKLARYVATGGILPPVRGFSTRKAAELWGSIRGRDVVLELDVDDARTHLLPDHHNRFGRAFWSECTVMANGSWGSEVTR